MVFSSESRCPIDKATTQGRRETKPSATKQHFGCTNSKYNSCACYARAFPCCHLYYTIVIIYFWPFLKWSKSTGFRGLQHVKAVVSRLIVISAISVLILDCLPSAILLLAVSLYFPTSPMLSKRGRCPKKV